MTQENTQVQPQPADKAKIWGIWKVMLILLAVTAVEFAIAFMPFIASDFKVFIFIVLTLVKAFYIVGQFMHLSHERKSLIWSILLPIIFIAFLIFILIYQGSALYDALY